MTRLSDSQDGTVVRVRMFSHRIFSPRLVVILSILAFLVVLIGEAWLHEDAFITLRTIDNFVNGYGLRYNVTQRVQTYTHPLWLFLLTIPYFLTREPLFTTLLVAITVSLISLYLLLHYLAPSRVAKLMVAVMLISSRPFIDYATSGLENPLSHLLVTLFLILYFKKTKSRRNLFYLSLIAALAAVNRLDTLLIYVLPLALSFMRVRAIAPIILGFLPLAGWLLFSLFYYGFPLPNSAYAKLNIHVAPGDLYLQGLSYFRDITWRDPLTSLTILIAVLTSFVERNKKSMAVALGIILYLLYIVRIGGDYMSGRFFTIPFLLAVVLLVRSNWLRKLSKWQSAVLISAAFLIGLLSAHPVLLPIVSESRWRNDDGITDERQYYEMHTGLLQNLTADPPLEKHWLADNGLQAKEDGQALLIKGGIGLAGYFAGSNVHIVDNYALADGMLSHLPVANPDFWRIGHFNRSRPAGLEESLVSGVNELEDGALSVYYDKLLDVISGSLTDPQRLLTIWQLNTGKFDHLIDPDKYIADKMKWVTNEELNMSLGQGTMVEADGVVYIPYQGVRIPFDDVQNGTAIELTIDENYAYRLIFVRDGIVVDNLISQPGPQKSEILASRLLPIPDGAREAGFDELRIRPVNRGMDEKRSRGLSNIIIWNEK